MRRIAKRCLWCVHIRADAARTSQTHTNKPRQKKKKKKKKKEGKKKRKMLFFFLSFLYLHPVRAALSRMSLYATWNLLVFNLSNTNTTNSGQQRMDKTNLDRGISMASPQTTPPHTISKTNKEQNFLVFFRFCFQNKGVDMSK